MVFGTSLLYASDLYLKYRKEKIADGFVPFILVERVPVSPTASIFSLEPKNASTKLEAYHHAWKRGIWNFHFKQSQIQVVRAYTPLPPSFAPSGLEPLAPLTPSTPSSTPSSTTSSHPPPSPPRPAFPFAQTTQHLPPQVDADTISADQIPAIIKYQWHKLSGEISRLWDQRSEERMENFTESLNNLKGIQKQQEGDDPSVGGMNNRLRFFIRNEQHGEVSGWLHRLPLGSEIELRGPNLEYEIAPETKHILFLAGGTGIASAFQAAHALLSPEREQRAASRDSIDRPRISILWASRNRDDCSGGVSDTLPHPSPAKNWTWLPWLSAASKQPQPQDLDEQEKSFIVEDLEVLKRRNSGQVTVDYFVDAENTFIDAAAITRLLSESHGINATPVENTEIIISGPDGFVNYLAGPKEWRGGKEEQGPLSGVLAQALESSPHRPKVWKV